MRVLGIDHGGKRLGIAWSDPLLVAAHPGLIIERRDDARDLAQLAALIAEREVVLVVVGLPRNMDGSEGPQAAEAREFMSLVAAHLGPAVPVVAWDERLSTRAADEILAWQGIDGRTPRGRQRRRAARDAVAASLILASYLEAHRAELRKRFGFAD